MCVDLSFYQTFLHSIKFVSLNDVDLPTSELLTFELKNQEPGGAAIKTMVSGLLSWKSTVYKGWKKFKYPMPPEKKFYIVVNRFGAEKQGKIMMRNPEKYEIKLKKQRWKCDKPEEASPRCAEVSKGKLFWLGMYVIKVKESGKLLYSTKLKISGNDNLTPCQYT